MGRILAIDVGQKRIGLAVTDPLKIIATELATIHISEIWKFLEDYSKKETIELVVVGMPKQMNNEFSESKRFVDDFIKNWDKKFPNIPLKTYDERFTSKMAQRAMIDGGMKKKDRQDKSKLDSISATILLQDFLKFNSL
ncbi:MAG: Holliday junction DNA helicase RuvA [Bacteroidetes bacterium GWA2_31_9]|nr:MAG: Holliday junction DNA helicase RuvA [Bacteroidetes bacterium GWA2_31_9]